MGNDQKRVEINDPETGEVVGLMTGMLVSNVRDYFLSRRRAAVMATTWDKLSEDQQKDEIEMATDVAEELVAKIVDLVAAGGHDVIHAKLDNFKSKDGAVTITAKGVSDDGALLALNRIGHKNLKIVVADADKYDEQRDKVEAEPDQADFLGGEAPADPQMDDEDDLHADDADDGQVETKLDESEAVPDPEDVAAEGVPDAEAVAAEGADDDLKDDSFGQGARTAERGEGKDQNPYSEGSTKFKFWNEGFDSVKPVDE